jgi:heme exporter protein A
MANRTSETPEALAAGLDVRSVTKRFDGREVLRGVSIELPAGQALCLCGPNGAGKSTLLRVIAGLVRADSGSVTVDGTGPTDDPALYKRRLGVISHVSMVYPDLTVLENLAFVAQLYGVSKRATGAKEALVDVGLEAFQHERAGILSRGLLQRLAIARALLHGPSVLLADEPFTGLDEKATRWFTDRVGRFADEGGSVLMTTHDVKLALRCCQRVAVLDCGTLLLDARCDEVDSDRFAQDYLSYARDGN